MAVKIMPLIQLEGFKLNVCMNAVSYRFVKQGGRRLARTRNIPKMNEVTVTSRIKITIVLIY